MTDLNALPLSLQLSELSHGLWELVQEYEAVQFKAESVHEICDLLRDMSRQARQLECAVSQPVPEAKIVKIEHRIIPDHTMPCLALLRNRKPGLIIDDPYDGGDAA